MLDRLFTPRSQAAVNARFEEFTLPSIDGGQLAMRDYAGKVVLLVNVASQCGFTPQYAGLEALWRRYKDRGFVIIGSPCDQFGNQEPGNEGEIASFCQLNYDVTFPLSSKLDVNGDQAHPLWRWLRVSAPGVLKTEGIKWNFTKFLVDRRGQVLNRYASTATPESLVPDIERALAETV